MEGDTKVSIFPSTHDPTTMYKSDHVTCPVGKSFVAFGERPPNSVHQGFPQTVVHKIRRSKWSENGTETSSREESAVEER